MCILAAAASISKAKTDGSDSVGGVKVDSAPGGAASLTGHNIQDGASDVQGLDNDKITDFDKDLQEIGEEGVFRLTIGHIYLQIKQNLRT